MKKKTTMTINILHSSGNHVIVEARPMKIPALSTFRFFYHRSLSGSRYKWTLTEFSTGAGCGHGDHIRDLVPSLLHAMETNMPKGDTFESQCQDVIDKFGIANN